MSAGKSATRMTKKAMPTLGRSSILCSWYRAIQSIASGYVDAQTSRGDTYAVSQRFWEFSAIFVSPVRLVIALTFLYQYGHLSLTTVLMLTIRGRVLGWSALSGVAVVLVSYVVNYPLAKYNIYVRDKFCIDRNIGLF